ncbi:radical SAM protein [Streptomyces sp. NBC_00829]|uniref:radical SAM protein n=1 Tax=Streptomyces sp. NBC_00829 TaxID=2903679 RepID=UPI003867E6E4|nr:radical SAM protein [Streptomyces sp. NBC_00829]
MDLQFPAPGDTLLTILKLVGETCNINCHYCYERRKPYEQALRLSPDTLRRFLNKCGDRPLALELHGGEPLLLPRRRMAQLLEVIRQYPGPVSVAMQTNGTLLDDAWLDFFDEQWPDIEIGVSLDGDEEGNAHRVDFTDRPVYHRITAALDLLGRRGREVGVIAVVTRKMLGRAPQVLENIARFPCVKAIKMSPCFDYNVVSKQYRTANRRSLAVLNPDGVGVPGWALTPTEYADFAIEMYDTWRDLDLYRQFTIEPFISVIRAVAGKPNSFESFSDRKTPYIVTLYPDGRIGTSDELSLPHGLLGHLNDRQSLDEMVSFAHRPKLRADLQRVLTSCSGCSHLSTCRGGMLGERLRYEGSPLADEYCDARKRLIDHVAATVPTGVASAA